jgi:hypothetical protein
VRVTSTLLPASVTAARPALLALAAATGLLLAGAPARAQIGACEDLKARLAQRISGGPGSYVMEAVPAATAVPPGVKVIGTCGGGAWKVLFRRGSAPIVLDGATSAPTASLSPSSSQGASSPAPKPTRAEAARADATASAPAPGAASRQESARTARSPAPPVTPPVPAAPVLPLPAEPVAPVSEATASSPGTLDAAVSDTSTPDGWRTLVERHRLWLAAGLVGLPLAAWLYAWVARRRAYDEQGLPRGPRLN